MNLLYILPVVIVVGVVFLVFMNRRSRPPLGPDNGTGGRPDETETPELRGPEQHRRRAP